MEANDDCEREKKREILIKTPGGLSQWKIVILYVRSANASQFFRTRLVVVIDDDVVVVI